MNNIDNLSFGQRIDPENGLVECWFTHGALDWIKQQDWTNKVVLMYGAGLGDVWLSKRCKELHVIERNEEWLDRCATIAANSDVCRLFYHYRPCNDSSGESDFYLKFPKGIMPDIIISDDAYRTEAVFKAIDYFENLKGLGYILICDNYWQDYVWKSPKAIEVLEPFKKLIFSQPDHVDYEEEGCEWKTAIIFI